MKKQDIILLHGWNLSGDHFAPLTLELTKRGYAVYTPDLPGFGKEKQPERPWHVVDYAEFIADFCKKKSIHHAIFIGHSFGGRVSLKIAQLYPDLVCILVLTGTPGFSPVSTKKLLLFLVIAKIGRIVFMIPPLSFFSDWAKRWLYVVAGAREFFKAEGTMKQTFKNVVKDDLVAAMTSVKTPTLLLWGEYDVMVPVAIAKRMKDVIFGASLVVIPESDHGVPYKEPIQFSEYIDTYVASKHI